MVAFLQRNIFWILGLAILAGLCYIFTDIVAYVLVAWVLSMLGRPLVIFYKRRIRFRNWRLGSAGASILTILTFYLFILGILWLFVPSIVQQGRNIMAVDFGAIGTKLEEPFANLDQELHTNGLLKAGESLADKIQEALLNWFGPEQLGDVLGTFIATAGDLVIAFAAITFILFFFSTGQHPLFGHPVCFCTQCVRG